MKTVWITGGSRGIGSATVHAFAKAGWNVAFTYLNSHEKAKKISEQYENVIAIQGDVTNFDDMKKTVQKIHDKFGMINSIICNAGIAQQKMFCDITSQDWDNIFNTNVKSALFCIQSMLPDMINQKSGSIVTVSSMWGITGASCESHYSASKGALIALSKSLAQELGLSGIRVNCIAPGVIDTDMNGNHDEQTMQELADQTPLGRIGKADEVAKTILFLCSEDSSFITGQVIEVTGGF